MSHIAVIGEPARVQGFALAGAEVCPADEPDAVRTAWDGLAADVTVVVLTPAAARALEGTDAGRRLTVVMPE
jgi:vacuolar-type H+-ATPase subunit F/Vma7